MLRDIPYERFIVYTGTTCLASRWEYGPTMTRSQIERPFVAINRLFLNTLCVCSHDYINDAEWPSDPTDSSSSCNCLT
jgi:hypothetical protein